MGEVYEAQDRQFKEAVALKVVPSEYGANEPAVRRFLQEAQLARKVTHRSVCRIFDVARDRLRDQEIIFLTMELLSGESLSARLQREGRIGPEQALPLAFELCRGLQAVHDAGILHRDLKPANVMLVPEEDGTRAVLTDFGIAQWLHAAGENGNVTTTNSLLATPAYASPEQLQGKPLTTASDVYSLGALLFEIVTGTRPFEDSSAWKEALKRVAEDPPTPSTLVPGLSGRWDRTLLGCLHRNPGDRFCSAIQVQESLSGDRWRKALRLKSAIAAAALLVGVGAGTVIHHLPWLAALPQQKHVAILPFDFPGQGPGEQAEAYGLAESLATDLEQAAAPGDPLWVAPWTEVQKQLRDQNPRLGASLGVNLLLSGILEKHDGSLLARLSLKDAATLRELRSSQIEIAQGTPLEEALARGTYALLQLKSGAEALRRLPGEESTVPGAYQFYLEGRGHLARRDQENTNLAITLFATAIQTDPSFAPAYADLALAYSWKYRDTREERWHTQAREACRRGLALNPDLARAHLALGSIELDSGEVESSIREFELALRLEPANVETRNFLARAYDAAGRPLQAESVLKDALKRNPGVWINYNDLGYFYYRHAQYQQAEPLFRAATELAPGNPRPLADLGGVYLALGQYELARQVLSRGVSIRPSAGALSNLGTAEFRMGHYAEAAAWFQKAVALRPGDDSLWRNLGDARSAVGDQTGAAQAYSKAVESARTGLALHPRNSQLLQNLAVCYARLGERARAEEALRQAPRSAGSDPEFLFSSALVYELNGERGAALASLRSAVQAGYSQAEIEHAAELSSLRADVRYATQVTGTKP
jgi:serine/threonine-protein kinase